MKSKNIHILKTDKPSRLLKDLVDETYQFKKEVSYGNRFELPLNIYITSDEEIKEGDWIFDLDTKSIVKADSFKVITSKKSKCWYYKKIILTTDQDLIKDGVQAIDDEFLEWFVKNPSCDFAHLGFTSIIGDSETKRTYKIIIPKEEPKQEDCSCTDECLGYLTKSCKRIEEPKQETLEEAAEKYSENWEETTGLDYENTVPSEVNKLDFINGAKWQAERMYSEEELIQLLIKFNQEITEVEDVRIWFEQFKKK